MLLSPNIFGAPLNMAFRSHYLRTCAAYMPFLALMLTSYAMAESTQEKQKCVQQLEVITTCLPYVGGEAKAPSPDCCKGLKEAIKNDGKCLCLIVKDGNDPDLGLNINITLALGMPYICKAPENLSQCPALLHLDPNSAEAQIFNQLNKSMTSTSPPSSPAAEGSSPGDVRTSTPPKNEASYNGKRMLTLKILGVAFLIWFNICT